ncbi:MAG: molybdopterin-dependent oxidoreductase [Burkholderiaceae bacterium]
MAHAVPRETRSTCPYCGVGCGVIIESTGAQITGVRGDPDHPANAGRLCAKGSMLHLTATAPVTLHSRLLQPMRREHRGAAPRPLGWDAALDVAATGLQQIIAEHGPDAVGFYISGQLLTEDYYVFNKLAKGLVGTNNIDSNSRLCMSSAVAGYKQTLGADAPPCSYEDIDHAACIFIVGANPAFAHPVLFRRIEAARRANPHLKIIVADPRRTDSCTIADHFLQIQPGTDVLLFQGMLHLMLWEGWIDTAFIAAHTSGFDTLKASVRDATPERVAQACGIDRDDLVAAARLFATSRATLSLYCQGLNQSSSGTAKNAALINLHLATAQIGRAGAGPFSLTGQPNAMGGREVGGMANLLSGHRDMADPRHRAEVAALWGVDAVPATPGRTAVDMFQAAADGAIRALWICCTNPAQSLPEQSVVRRALERAELVIVQEAFAGTATCAYADLLLPAASWGEKEGTVTNSERRISRVRAAVDAPGQARRDWEIVVDLARRLEARLPHRAGRPTLFPYTDAESVWNEHRASTRGRDLDITGMSYALLEQAGPQQWPMPAGTTQGRARLYTDGRFATPDGRARFVATPYRAPAEARDARYPFTLNTGRLRDQWHGMSRTGTSGRAFAHVAEPAVQMHPRDMARRQLEAGDLVQLTSRRGSIVVPVQRDADLAPGQVFLAMHWGSEYLGGRSSVGTPLAGVNALTTPARCPDSHQPELKHAAVKLLKAELPWTLLAQAWLPPDRALRAQERLRALMPQFAFAVCVPFASRSTLDDSAQARDGVLLRCAAAEPPADALLATIEQILGLDATGVLRYADRQRGQRRAMRLAEHNAELRLEAFLLAGDTRAQSWIQTVLQDQRDARAFGRQLLAPVARAPAAIAARDQPVCTCFNVSQQQIAATLAEGTGTASQRLDLLQQRLQCGTNCGSCVPELRRLAQASCMAMPAPLAA